MNLFSNFVNVFWYNAFNFRGRARRKEYWFYMIVYSLIIIALSGLIEKMPSLFFAIVFVFCFPTLSLSIRRLHDIGRSGWWYLLSFTGAGGLLIFAWTLVDSEEGENEYGPDPKANERLYANGREDDRKNGTSLRDLDER
ncbi:MAG: DUF805 domain-containing protein [Marinilabiliaceae bacterium]